ncbi:hypothetical protein Bca101_058501 [Brassica carinata]
MESSRLFSTILFLYTIILSISSIICTENNNNLVTDQAALFVFGDSLFDVGNNNYINTTTRSNFFPYGQTFFKFPTGRVSDGRLITDFIAEKAWLPLIPPNLQPGNSNSQLTYGVNFASAGAGALVETFPGTSTKKRKFGFLNMGAYECAPPSLILDPTNIGSCSKPVAELINLHNKKFPDALNRLQRELSGFRYALHDYHTSLLDRINNPSKYGFKVGQMGCCGSGPFRGINTCGGRMGQNYELCENVNDYLFFDSSHLTEKAHQQIAELVWSGPPNVTGPYNLKALFELN